MKPHPNKRRNQIRRSCQQFSNSFEKLENRALLTVGNGLQAQYFDTTSLSEPALVRVDSTINFDWGTGSPDATIGNDTFSVRWSGEVESQFTETYSFIVNGSDGARLWVNGQLLIDEFESGSLSNETATIDLIAGRRYDIQLEYRENTGNASISLEWSSESLAREVIPSSRLYASDRGSITSERWNGITGDDIADLTSDASFPNTPDSASLLSDFETPTNTANNFGRRVHGYVHAPRTGPYTFYISGDQAAELWLSNTELESGKTLIASVDSPTSPQQWDADASQESATIYLVAGQKYFIEALHKDSSGSDHLAVGWIQPGTDAIEVIAGEHLSPTRPTVQVFTDRPDFSEDSTAPARFEVTRTGPTTNAIDVAYTTYGDATEGVDYQATSGVVTIPAGQSSATIEFNALADSDVEGNETLAVELLAGSGYDVGLRSQRTAYATLQDDVDAPAGGTNLWDGEALTDFTRFGGSFSTVSDPTFGNVIQAVIPGGFDSPSNSQHNQSINIAVNEGDLLWVEFRARSVGGAGEISAIFEQNSGPFTKSL